MPPTLSLPSKSKMAFTGPSMVTSGGSQVFGLEIHFSIMFMWLQPDKHVFSALLLSEKRGRD